MEIRLRPAEENDAHLLFQWRNDPVAARNSLHNNPLQWIEHKAWLDSVLEDKSRNIFIAEFEPDRPFGMIRLDWLPDGPAAISINIDPYLRGKGMGKALLKQTIAQFPKTRLFATIRSENVASLIIFLASGFMLVEYNPISGLVYLKREPK